MGAQLNQELVQRASLAVIKSVVDGEISLLLQFDGKANQYQLIGGRLEIGENPKDAIIREINEEIPEAGLVYNQNYFLHSLNINAFTASHVSPTTGVETFYEFWIFLVSIDLDLFVIEKAINKWIPIPELMNNEDGFYEFISSSLGYSIEKLEDSIPGNKVLMI